MISEATLKGYQAKAKGAKIPQGTRLKKTGAPISEPEEELAWQLTGAGIPFRREVRFHPRRKYAADFAVGERPEVLLVEVEGQGRHQRRVGFEADAEKYAEALMLGFVVLRVTPRHIQKSLALRWITSILGQLST